LKNGNLLRQQKNPDCLCMRNTLRTLDFFASLHLTVFERPVYFDFFNRQATDRLQNGDLLRQRKNPDRLCMSNTLRGLDFFASLHLTIFERSVSNS
jgi:hypothetical protein